MIRRRLVSRPVSLRARLGVAVVGLALVSAACGGGSSSDGGDTPAGGSGGLKGKTINFVGYGNDNPWGAYFNGVFTKKLEAEGAKVVDLTTMDPGTAVQNVNQAISNKPDLIVTALLDTSSMVVPIKKAKQAGVPVLVFDGRPDPQVDDDVMQVISDNEAVGKAAADNLIEGLKAQGKESAKIIAITGTKSSLVTQDRLKAFDQQMATAPQYEVIETQDGNWDPTLSGKIATQLFAKYGCDGIQGAYGMADYQALPIIASAKQAGCEVAGDTGLVVTSSNCFKAGIEAIQAGDLYGTATEDPGTIANQTADYVIRYFDGAKPPKKEVVKEERVTAANVAEFAAQCSNA
ncbi:sugar ABC transporter substrate-binding protein [Aeromicrobium endophyticum]|uniref:Sugar ABC transporter substrate-binding protein n=1 Tax=Aeromicrobium endophyticum TaxID=2292704 RepID=A0A371PAW9_9ACTN|nr:sugar ABC transporter substrate-binding protein [Aeromicrobium endophyticum]REK73095.1 sugar ABC transporter substrate-binding protein [Aeromicrobium endophyticum]